MLKPGPDYEKTGGYTTIDQAVTDGAVILAYGCVFSWISYLLPLPFSPSAISARGTERDAHRTDWGFLLLLMLDIRRFVAHLINFLSMGFALYGMAAIYQKASKEPMIRRQVKCRYCRKWINEKVYFSFFRIIPSASSSLGSISVSSWQWILTSSALCIIGFEVHQLQQLAGRAGGSGAVRVCCMSRYPGVVSLVDVSCWLCALNYFLCLK